MLLRQRYNQSLSACGVCGGGGGLTIGFLAVCCNSVIDVVELCCAAPLDTNDISKQLEEAHLLQSKEY